MKRLIYILLILGLYCSCTDDETVVFDTPMPNVTFAKRAGGAVMRYQLPANTDVQAINIRYRDALGQEMFRTGSYACDSLIIIGFNEARENIPATVTLSNRSNEESEPMEVTFDTDKSGPVAFFDDLNVFVGWNGFSISYNAPEHANGMAHVFYLGKDPNTGLPDTLLLNTFPIEGGRDTLAFQVKQLSSANTVVIRTEDFRGYMVKESVWENVPSYNVALLNPTTFDFLDPEGLSIEDPAARVGKDYLFDGDTKGETFYGLNTNTAFATYISKVNPTGKTLFILDLREAKNVAMTKLYAMLYVNDNFPWPGSDFGNIWQGAYVNKLPCDVAIYASNDMDDANSWREIGHFSEDPRMDMASRWCSRTVGNLTERYSTIDAIRAAEPIAMQIDFPATAEPFRFLKVVVNEVFEHRDLNWPYKNTQKHVTIQEFEVYAKEN
ncbi:DUF4959 domain-containing protein [Butyricimonas sp.]|uniref:DUF4959 domain-containing protein n=1 Tax=Butyricimonas sp. TaxID=1969738 RepID=UPI0025C29244|nr:DUF4959 domain-containing protein [Butyricimonas sp.]